MVHSKTDSKNVTYDESPEIDDEDLDYSSPLFDFKLFGKDIIIGLGKQRDTFIRHHIIFFPIYLIIGEIVRAKIGIFEIDSRQIDDLFDEDGDVKLKKKNLLFFLDKDKLEVLIKKYEKEASQHESEKTEKELEELQKNEQKDEQKDEKVLVDEDNDSLIDEDDVLELKVPEGKQTQSDKQTALTLQDGLFTVNPKIKEPPSLKEETKDEAKDLKQDFKESPSTEWIAKMMKNDHYEIIDNEGGGDCFFAVIRDAFKQIGKETTVAKLRALIAREATDELYQQSRSIYLGILAEQQEKKKEQKTIAKTIKLLGKRVRASKNKEESDELTEQAKTLLEQKKRLDTEEKESRSLLQEFDYLENLTTLEKFREYMLTRDYWADTWTISTMEKLLNVKVIILSKQEYQSGDVDSVMQCGQLNDKDLENAGAFTPDFYILTSYESGNHYKTVSYKEKKILKFREIPYDIKIMIINKCLEKNAGPYYLIQDFRNLKTSLGLDPDEGTQEEEEDEYLVRDLYDKNTVFSFYSKAGEKPKAGRGSGEKIDKNDLSKFNVLNSIDHWRRKLDDSWITPFSLDSHRWNSVEHYFLASQFKKGFPDFYLKFSVESGTDISKELELARVAGSKSGKTKTRVLREPAIKIDPDFYTQSQHPIFEVERKKALLAKFSGNMELKNLLLETRSAKLVHFERSQGRTPDKLLMEVRKELSVEESSKSSSKLSSKTSLI